MAWENKRKERRNNQIISLLNIYPSKMIKKIQMITKKVAKTQKS